MVTFTDILYNAGEPGARYASDLINFANPEFDRMNLPARTIDPMTVGQGYSSNIRHGIGTSLIRDKLMEMAAPITEFGGEFDPENPGLLTRGIGNIGATGAAIGEELADAGSIAYNEFDGLGSLFDKEYYKKIFTQPKEDVLANLQGLLYTQYGGKPVDKYSSLMNLYSQNKGIFTPSLNKIIQGAEPYRVTTQKMLADAVENNITAGQKALGQTLEERLNQRIAGQAYKGTNSRGDVQTPTMTPQQMVQEAKDTGGTVNPHEVTKAASKQSSYSRRPNMADVSGPSSSSSSSKPRNSPSSSSSSYNRFGRFGRADGGMVSLMDLLNRRV